MLFHYTSAEGLIGILKNKKMWATSHLHLNDSREFQIAAQMISEAINSSQPERWKKYISELTAQALVVSFSEKGDLLSQWRGYCPSGQGYSLGFRPGNPLFTFNAPQKSFGLVKCEYKEKEQRRLCHILASSRPAIYSPDQPADQWRQFREQYSWRYSSLLLNAALKDSGFKEEREWRLVSQYPEDLPLSFRRGRYGLAPYYELPLSPLEISSEPGTPTGEPMIDEIIIGPSANSMAATDALKRALKKFDCEQTEIKLSKIPLRT